MSTTTTQTDAAKLSKGYFIAVIATVIWSTTAIFIRYLTENYGMPPLVLAFWRDLFVCLALGAALRLVKPGLLLVSRRHVGFLVFYGLVLAVFNSLWTVSVALNGAAVSTVLAYSAPAFTALAAWRFFGESLGQAKVLAVIVCITGCAFVSGAYELSAWQVNPLGITVGFLSGIAFAGYSLMGKGCSFRSINPWTALFYSFGFAATFLLAFNLVPGLLPGRYEPGNLMWLGSSLSGWGMLALLGVGPTIGGYGLYTVSLTYLPASVASLVATLEPSLTAIQAYLLLNERLSALQLFGSALIVGGVILLRVHEGRASYLPLRRVKRET